MPEEDPRWREAIREGRSCPRVELDQGNLTPYALVVTAASEHTRALLPARLDALTRGLKSSARDRIVERVFAGLTCEAVVNRLYPPRDK